MSKQASDRNWRRVSFSIGAVVYIAFMAALIGFILGFTIARARGCELPADPIQRVAEKALRGDWPLEWWQRRGYEKLQQVEPKKRLAWITCYSHLDPGCNRTTASGMPVSKRVAAWRI